MKIRTLHLQGDQVKEAKFFIFQHAITKEDLGQIVMPNLNFKPVRTFWRATRKIVPKHEQSLRNAILKEKEVSKHISRILFSNSLKLKLFR